MNKSSELTHVDDKGQARMVDVGSKEKTNRTAVATGVIKAKSETVELVEQQQIKKGDVLATARIAGIQAAKKTSELVPLCHNISLTSVKVDIETDCKKGWINVRAEVTTTNRTGVEMEALTAVSVACLTIYDMCKAVDKQMIIDSVYVCEKTGGRSGDWVFTGGSNR